jgi:hypothetical protein
VHVGRHGFFREQATPQNDAVEVDLGRDSPHSLLLTRSLRGDSLFDCLLSDGVEDVVARFRRAMSERLGRRVAG